MKEITLTLPSELWVIVFTFLSFKDLCSVILVCQLWKSLGENPSLWKMFTFCIKREHVRRMEEVFSIPRFQHIRRVQRTKISINDAMDNATVFKAISRKDSIKELIIHGSNLANVSPEIISLCVNKLQRFDFVPHIWGTGLSRCQVSSLFDKMKSETCLRVLNLRSNDLSAIPATVLGECMNKLVEADLWNTSLSCKQVEEILINCKKKTCLKKLNISGNYFGMLDVPVGLIRDVQVILKVFQY